MATTVKAQFWGYTLNNHTTQELVLIRDPPPSVGIVHHVFTPEEGTTNGTPHIQGYVKIRTQVRKSHLIKRWLERASFRPLNSDEYQSAMLHYVQKQDATARGATTQSAPPQALLLYPAMVPEMIIRWIHENTEEHADMFQHGRTSRDWFRWSRDTRSVGEEFRHWIDRQTDKTDTTIWRHHSMELHSSPAGEVLERVHVWSGREFNPAHEAPWVLMVEFAKSQLVRRHQCETLMMRPDVCAAIRRYSQEILWRIEHTPNADPESLSEASDDEAPPPPSGPPTGSSPPPSDAEPNDG